MARIAEEINKVRKSPFAEISCSFYLECAGEDVWAGRRVVVGDCGARWLDEKHFAP